MYLPYEWPHCIGQIIETENRTLIRSRSHMSSGPEPEFQGPGLAIGICSPYHPPGRAQCTWPRFRTLGVPSLPTRRVVRFKYLSLKGSEGQGKCGGSAAVRADPASQGQPLQGQALSQDGLDVLELIPSRLRQSARWPVLPARWLLPLPMLPPSSQCLQ